MKEKINIIRESITMPLQKMNIIVDNIEFRNEGKYEFLTITLDKINGLDMDSIVEATNVINPIIDKLDISDDSYILDVISKEKGEVNNG